MQSDSLFVSLLRTEEYLDDFQSDFSVTVLPGVVAVLFRNIEICISDEILARI